MLPRLRDFSRDDMGRASRAISSFVYKAESSTELLGTGRRTEHVYFLDLPVNVVAHNQTTVS